MSNLGAFFTNNRQCTAPLHWHTYIFLFICSPHFLIIKTSFSIKVSSEKYEIILLGVLYYFVSNSTRFLQFKPKFPNMICIECQPSHKVMKYLIQCVKTMHTQITIGGRMNQTKGKFTALTHLLSDLLYKDRVQ